MNWVLLTLASALFLSFRAISIKKALTFTKSMPLLFLTSLLGFLFLIPFRESISFNIPLFIYGIIFVKSVLLGISWFCMYEAYKLLEVSTIAPLRNLSPVFSVTLGILFLSERVSIINAIGIVLMIVSAYSLEIKSPRNLLRPLKLFKKKEFLFILIALIGNGTSAVLDKYILQFIGKFSLIFMYYLFIVLIYLSFLFYRKEINEVLKIFKSFKMVSFAVIISLLLVMADLSYFFAVAIPGSLIILITPLRRASGLFTVVIGGRIFKESKLLYKSFISIIMILGILLIAI